MLPVRLAPGVRILKFAPLEDAEFAVLNGLKGRTSKLNLGFRLLVSMGKVGLVSVSPTPLLPNTLREWLRMTGCSPAGTGAFSEEESEGTFACDRSS